MHIHGNSMSIEASSFYSIANQERAAAAQVRKRLLKAAHGAPAGSSQEETLLIGKWMETGPNQMTTSDEYRGSAHGTESSFQ